MRNPTYGRRGTVRRFTTCFELLSLMWAAHCGRQTGQDRYGQPWHRGDSAESLASLIRKRKLCWPNSRDGTPI